MKRLVYILLLGCLLLAAAACSRDPEVDVPYSGIGTADETGITLTLVVPSFETVETRAAGGDVENLSIDEVCVICFSADGKVLWYKKLDATTADSTDWNSSDDGKTVKIRISEIDKSFVSLGELVVVANANDKISQLTPGTTTRSQIEAITFDATAAADRTILSGSLQGSVASNAGSLQLGRSVAKTTVKCADGVALADVVPVRWERLRSQGYLLDGCSSRIPATSTASVKADNEQAAAIYAAATLNGTSAGSFVRMVFKGKYNGAESYSYYAVTFDPTEYSTLDQIRPNHNYEVTVTGVARAGGTEENPAEGDAVAYKIVDQRAQVFDMVSNGDFLLGVSDTIRLNGSGKVSGTGDDPVLIIKLGWNKEVDEEFSGYANHTTEKGVSLPNFNVDLVVDDDDWLSYKYSGATILLFGYEEDEAGNLTPAHDWEMDGPITDAEGDGEYGVMFVRKLKYVSANSDTYRTGTIKVIWTIPGGRGVLERTVVVTQEADFSDAKEFLTVAATVKTEGEATVTYPHYFQRADDENTFLGNVAGVTSSENEGRARNHGFHFPLHSKQTMSYVFEFDADSFGEHEFVFPDDGTVYKDPTGALTDAGRAWVETKVNWEFSIEDAEAAEFICLSRDGVSEGSSVSGTGLSTLTGIKLTTKTGVDIGPNSDYFHYRIWEGALKLKLTEQPTDCTSVLAYDLYRTGFFYASDKPVYYADGTTAAKNKCFYYEVMVMNGRWWLDRNLGASSAGFCVLGDSYIGDKAAAGGLYSIWGSTTNNIIATENPCPKNYTVPTQSLLRGLVNSANFSQERIISSDGGDYYDAKYTMPADPNYDCDGRNVYFPKVRMADGNTSSLTVSGTSNVGYYWTTTEAVGASGTERGYWLQYLSFIGRSASFGRNRVCSSSDTNNRAYMSVRCVNETNSEQENEYSILIWVKNCTHVCIGTLREDGQFVPLDEPLPGRQIATAQSATAQYWDYTYYYTATAEYSEIYFVFTLANGSLSDPVCWTKTGGDFYDGATEVWSSSAQ